MIQLTIEDHENNEKTNFLAYSFTPYTNYRSHYGDPRFRRVSIIVQFNNLESKKKKFIKEIHACVATLRNAYLIDEIKLYTISNHIVR